MLCLLRTAWYGMVQRSTSTVHVSAIPHTVPVLQTGHGSNESNRIRDSKKNIHPSSLYVAVILNSNTCCDFTCRTGCHRRLYKQLVWSFIGRSFSKFSQPSVKSWSDYHWSIWLLTELTNRLLFAWGSVFSIFGQTVSVTQPPYFVRSQLESQQY